MGNWYSVTLDHPTRKHAVASLGVVSALSEDEAKAETAEAWDLPIERLSARVTEIGH